MKTTKIFTTQNLQGYQVIKSDGDIEDTFITSGYKLDIHATDISDGYHTFDELYRHRYALFAALVKVYDGYRTPLESAVTCWKSKLHADGSSMEGYFIVQMIIKNLNNTTEQISYHVPMEWWDKFNIMEIEKAWPHDGHSSDDVIERLLKL